MNEKLHIVNISILPKLFYRVHGIPVEIQTCFCEIWKAGSEIGVEERSGKESQDAPREKQGTEVARLDTDVYYKAMIILNVWGRCLNRKYTK